MERMSMTHRRIAARSGRERGVVMIVTLIVLVVLLVGAAALLRSTDGASTLAGQLGFRRDLKNQAERAIATAVASLKTGSLASSLAREEDMVEANYSAVELDTDASTGLPTILLASDAKFEDANYTINIIDATDGLDENTDTGIKVRYVIDRLCLASGSPTASNCSRTNVQFQNNGQDTKGHTLNASFLSLSTTVYRISVRVDGPRGTQAFVQSAVAL